MNRIRTISNTIVALLVTVVFVFGLDSDDAEAGVDTSAMEVAVAVGVRCVIATGELSFGSTYTSGQAANLDSQGVVVVACDPGRRVSIKMGQGLYPRPGSTDNNPLRRMRNGSNYLNYNLYEDAARTTVWDNRSNGVKTTRVFPYTATVYGRIPGSQVAYPGVYSDTIVATVHY